MVKGRLDIDLETHCISSWDLLQKFKELKKETEDFVGDDNRDYWHQFGQGYLEIIEELHGCMSHLDILFSELYKRSEHLYNGCIGGAYYKDGVKHTAGIQE